MASRKSAEQASSAKLQAVSGEGATSPPVKRDLLEEARKVWDRFSWPGTDEMIAATAIIRGQQVIVSRMDAILRPRGLSYSRFELLIILYASRAGQLPLGKVSQRLLIHPTSVTGLVDRLEKDGMVAREPNARDRRGVIARITDKGRAIVEELAPELGRQRFGFHNISAAEIKLVTIAIDPIRRSAGDIGEE